MRFLFPFCLLILFGTTLQTSAQPIQKGNFLFQGYYGYKLQGARNTKAGPIGMRIEYLLKDRFSIVFDYSYLYQKNTETGYHFNNPENGSMNNATCIREVNAMSLGTNFYFINKNRFNLSFTLGCGYRAIYKNYNLEDEDDIDPVTNNSAYMMLFQESPFILVCKLGVGYFVTKHFAINLSTGFSHGGIINGGFSYRW